MRKLFLAATFLLGLPLAAHAELIITVNGMQKATDSTNTAAGFSGSVDGFNLNTITATGVNAFGGNGTVLDIGSLNISTAGTGMLTLLITETGLSADSPITIYGTFTGTINNASVTRSLYLDPTNTGALTTPVGTTTSGGGDFSLNTTLTGPYSLTEEIVVTANGPGALLSSDDTVQVPEPMSLALLGSSLVGLGLVRRRRAH